MQEKRDPIGGTSGDLGNTDTADVDTYIAILPNHRTIQVGNKIKTMSPYRSVE